MPLDMTSEIRMELTRALGARAVVPFTAFASKAATDLCAGTKATFAIWRDLSAFDTAGLLNIRGSEWFAAASRAGGMVVENSKAINLGLLIKSLKAAPDVDAGAGSLPDATTFTPEEQTTWAIATRLARVEASRCLELLIGDSEYVLHADAEGFGIIEQSGGVARIREKIYEALANDASVEYTLGNLRETAPTSRHSATELLAEADGAAALFTASGWPVALPAGMTFGQASALMRSAQHMAAHDVQSLDLRTAEGALILRMNTQSDDKRIQTTFGS